MGRSSKAISLVLIGPALLGSTLLVSGCSPPLDEEPEQEEWVVAEGQDQGDSWGPPDAVAQEQNPNGGTGTHHHSSHRSNIGGFIGGYLGSRAASSAARGGGYAPSGGYAPAPAGGTASHVGGGTSHFGGASSRGGFGSSAGHASS